MSRWRSLHSGLLGLSTLALLWLAAGASAYAQGAAPPPTSQAPSPPPVVQFSADGVGIEEAIRLALTLDPAIQTLQAEVQRREGAARQQAGAFDLTLMLNAAFTSRSLELSEARKGDERDKRAKLGEFIADTAGEITLTQQVLAKLQEIQGLPPGAEAVRQLTQISPTLGSQLQVIDTLIANTPGNDKATLTQIRQDFINSMLADQRALLTEFQTARSDAIVRLANLGEAPVDELFRNGTFSAKLSKYFRNGVALVPFVDANVDSTTYVGKPISSDFGGKGIQDVWTFRAGADLVFPLLRGRGADVFGAAERAAKVEVDASRLALEHQASRSALAVARAYWELRAAQEAADVLTRSVEIESRIVEVTNALITAEELPRTELARAQAGEARARARLDDAKRRLLEARVGLARAMGLGAPDAEAALPRARDAFPALPAAPSLADAQVEALASAAEARRPDLEAARRREEASRILERAASLSRRPRLDLDAGMWATALGERTVYRVIDRWVLPSVGVGLAYEQPFGNNALEGQFVQREADRRQRQIAAADLARQMRLAIQQSARTLRETWDQAQLAASAAELYRQTVDAELERFRAGETTLINTLITEQQLTDALLTLVAARRDLASLVAELRYETGTLVSGGTIIGGALATLPGGEGRWP